MHASGHRCLTPQAKQLRPLSKTLLVALMGLITPFSWGQNIAPDAGSLRQQIEQQRELPLPPAARPTRSAPPPEIKPQAGVTLTVKAFGFAGNTLLNSEQLALSVADFLNRPLRFEDIQSAADAVAARYRQAGWIARVYLPEQEVGQGVVTLQVVEAQYAGLRFAGTPPQRVRPEEIAAFFQAGQPVGQPLSANALDRALLLADDLPGVSVSGTLVPGQADAETALVLNTADEPRVSGDISLDNTGARATGSQRLGANVNLNSPGGRGELVSLNLLHTAGSDYARVGLTVPDGYNGLRLGVSASALAYRVVQGTADTVAAAIQGRSSSAGVDLSYPLLRARGYNLYLSGGAESKSFFNSDKVQTRSDYDSYALRTGLSGNRFDDWGGGGANSASLQVLWGRLANLQAHTLKDSIDRQYRKLNYSLTRQQTLTPEHSLLLSLAGQQATQVLDSSEKFYVGGAQSVRAYPVSELGGERGHVLSGEWRWRLTPTVVLSAFVDHGRAVALPATSSDKRSALSLHGRGLSLAWQGPLGISTRAVWAHRNGANPKPTSLNTDSDGTLKKNRLWLTAGLPF